MIAVLHPPWAAPFFDVTPAATAGSEAPADPSSSHLTSYAVRLSPAQTHSSSQLSPRSSGPAQTWSGAGDGGQWQLGDSLLSSSPARGVSRPWHHLWHTPGTCRSRAFGSHSCRQACFSGNRLLRPAAGQGCVHEIHNGFSYPLYDREAFCRLFWLSQAALMGG